LSWTCCFRFIRFILENTIYSFILVNVKDENGKSIFAGRKATSFGNLEEDEIKLSDAIPFLVETRLKELGANFQRNDKAWGACVTVDGQRLFILISNFIFLFFCFLVILGANPASAHDFGLAILNALHKK
jgi:putative intracellular protease/amidase